MKKRINVVILAGMIFFFLAVILINYYLYNFAVTASDKTIVENQSYTYSPEIERIIDAKISLVKDLANEGELILYINKLEGNNSDLSQSEILKVDTRWRETSDEMPLKKSLLSNSLSKILKNFQVENPGFVEVFITDKNGLNIAQTNITSDYYQADESWWTDAYNNAKGKSYHGLVEFDESSSARSTAFYVPVINSDGVVIGVIKAVFDVDFIKKEL